MNRIFRQRWVGALCDFFIFFGFSWMGMTEVHAKQAPLRVGFSFNSGGKDDRSFNQSAYEGALRVQKELHAEIRYVEAIDDNFEFLLRDLAKRGFDPIIAVGASQQEAVTKISGEYPRQHFAIIDGQVNAPNVRSFLFQEHEGSFLVGMAAAFISKTGKVGFIGGMDIPLMHRFSTGFFAGARSVRPDVKTVSNYVGITQEAWNNPVKAKELAVSQYDSGVDVIFAAAGGSGLGLFDAAEEKKKFAIGVDSNQNWIKPGVILTSMVKKIDETVFQICKDFSMEKFEPGTQKMSLANNGVGYTVDAHNRSILKPEMQKKMNEARAKIISGAIQVPDYYLNRK